MLTDKNCKYLDADGEEKDLDDHAKKAIKTKQKEFARKGLRTLLMAYKKDIGDLSSYTGEKHPAHKILTNVENYTEVEANPVICGIVGILDPARPEVANSIKMCQKAGIFVIMITGDVKETATAIAGTIGIVHPDDKDLAQRTFTGKQFFESLSEKEREKVIDTAIETKRGLVLSRAEPAHKRHLVKLLTAKKQIVAMTGDGVNDAPALRQAHIGIAMGISGTEVSKEASDMILQDDNFSTIVDAVEEGRAIYENMKVTFSHTTNPLIIFNLGIYPLYDLLKHRRSCVHFHILGNGYP